MPILLGLLMIFFGLFINIVPTMYDPTGAIYLDFTDFNRPLGIIMIVAGGGLIWQFLKEAP
jgi:hypothetical protein